MSTPHGDPYGPILTLTPSRNTSQRRAPGQAASKARPATSKRPTAATGRRTARPAAASRRQAATPAAAPTAYLQGAPVGFGERGPRRVRPHPHLSRARIQVGVLVVRPAPDHRLLGHRLHNQPVLGGRHHPRYRRRHPAVAGRPLADGPAAARREPHRLVVVDRPGADSRLDRAARLLPGAGHTRTKPLQRRRIETRHRERPAPLGSARLPRERPAPLGSARLPYFAAGGETVQSCTRARAPSTWQ